MSWGALGPGSIDRVKLVSTDGRSWQVIDSLAGRQMTNPSSLRDRHARGLDPLDQPTCVLAWAAEDSPRRTATSPIEPGESLGRDASGSGNELIVSPGPSMNLERGTTRKDAAVTGHGAVGCTFVGGNAREWSLVVAGALDEGRSQQLDVPLFAIRPNPGATTSEEHQVFSLRGWPLSGSGSGRQPFVAVAASNGTVMVGGHGTPIHQLASSGYTALRRAGACGVDLEVSGALTGFVLFASEMDEMTLEGVAQRLAAVCLDLVV